MGNCLLFGQLFFVKFFILLSELALESVFIITFRGINYLRLSIGFVFGLRLTKMNYLDCDWL